MGEGDKRAATAMEEALKKIQDIAKAKAQPTKDDQTIINLCANALRK